MTDCYWIGTDEAGYGPNLGPLVIGISTWRVDRHGPTGGDLYAALADVISATASAPDRIAIADSKLLHRPGKADRLGTLERGVLTALAVIAKPAATWRELAEQICPALLLEVAGVPWYADYDTPLPVSVTGDRDDEMAHRWQESGQRNQVQLCAAGCQTILPAGFNRGIREHGSKGAVLSRATLALIESQILALPDQSADVNVVCDKHGGRNRYAGLLQGMLGNPLVRVIEEGRAVSRYELGNAERSIQICFRTKAESFLPSALASMVAKYWRELCMLAFNTYWQHKIPSIKPTAGYPVDAKRFFAEIRPLVQQLSIDEETVWRQR